MKYLKRFQLFEAIKPADLIQSGELFQQLKNYNQWEELLYPIKVDYIQEIHSKDLELAYDLIQDFLSVYPNRQIGAIKKNKRYFEDPIESCISIHLKGSKGWSTDDHFIFYKFEDEWWAVEIHLLGSYRYYICDGIEGLTAMWQHMKEWWLSPSIRQNESIEENPYYSIISIEEYDDNVRYPNQDFAQKDLKLIKAQNLAKNLTLEIKRNTGYHSYLEIVEWELSALDEWGEEEDKPLKTFEITQTEDEWFFVNFQYIDEYEQDYYKCDGIDGLIQFMKDNHLILPQGVNESKSESSFRRIQSEEWDQKVWGGTEEGDEGEEDFIRDNWQKFTKEEILKICHILYPDIDKSKYINYFPYLPGMIYDDYNDDVVAELSRIRFYIDDFTEKDKQMNIPAYAEVSKLRDEWFYVVFKPRGNRYTQEEFLMFECDQWDGFVECLNWIVENKVKSK